MIQRTQIASLRLFGPLIDAVVVACTYLMAMGARSAFRHWWPYDLIPGEVEVIQPLSSELHTDLLVLVVPVWVFFLHQQRTYDLPRQNRTDLLFIKIVRAIIMATLALLSLFFVLGLSEGISRSLIVAFAALSCVSENCFELHRLSSQCLFRVSFTFFFVLFQVPGGAGWCVDGSFVDSV